MGSISLCAWRSLPRQGENLKGVRPITMRAGSAWLTEYIFARHSREAAAFGPTSPRREELARKDDGVKTVVTPEDQPQNRCAKKFGTAKRFPAAKHCTARARMIKNLTRQLPANRTVSGSCFRELQSPRFHVPKTSRLRLSVRGTSFLWRRRADCRHACQGDGSHYS